MPLSAGIAGEKNLPLRMVFCSYTPMSAFSKSGQTDNLASSVSIGGFIRSAYFHGAKVGSGTGAA